MRNRYRGETEVPGVGVLRFDWDAIARLIDTLGQDFDAKLSDAFLKTDVETIAKVVAIGNGCTPEYVRDVSPPIIATQNAVTVALNLAYHGQREAPADPGENPPNGSPSIWSRCLGMLRRRRG